MKDKNTFACMIYNDTFERLSKTFNDDSLGRVLRAAFNYGFTGELPELEDPTESYACGELIDTFKRNKESYNQQSIEGSINASIQWAKTEADLRQRLAGIEGITSHEEFEAIKRWRSMKRRQ